MIAPKEVLPEPQILDFLMKFPPHFFAVRHDFSVTEFLKPETLHITNDASLQNQEIITFISIFKSNVNNLITIEVFFTFF